MAAGQQYSLSGNAAEMYERNMVPAMLLPFARDLVERAALRPGEAVLDVACGTGIVARLAWPMVAPAGRVVGVDLNAAMLEVAAKSGDVAVEWIAGDACALKFADREFDVVLCQQGLQFFPDRNAALAEMRRVLKPGGRLVANVWRPIEHNAGHNVLAAVLERRVSKEAAATRRAPFNFPRRNEIRALMEGTGFAGITVEIVAHIARFPSAEGMIRMMMAGTPLAAEMAKADAAVVDAVIAEVTEGLAAYEDDRGLAIPMQAWVMEARV